MELTTAHVALIFTALALIVPVLTALAMFLLQRLTGAGDKSGVEIDGLKNKVHALELAGLNGLNHTREHVAAQYATKEDIRNLEAQMVKSLEAQGRYHDALMTLLTPIANQLIGVSPVRK